MLGSANTCSHFGQCALKYVLFFFFLIQVVPPAQKKPIVFQHFLHRIKLNKSISHSNFQKKDKYKGLNNTRLEPERFRFF